MAILKCKMCGGDIEVSQDKTFGTCDSCGSTMTFPRIDDEQRANMFNRGNHFRRMGEFDKALAVYERILQEDDTDAEAHWCCVLCRFGIEYVEDPATFEFLPTCHRVSFDSILEDMDYQAALEYSDGITRRQYQKDAAKIAEVQKGILATSQNEEPFDVFICYKESEDDGERTRDSLYAQDIYYQLTEQGWRVFFSRITLEDKAGTEYEPYIFAALNSAKVMVMITTSEEHANAVWVKNEWSRFLALMRKDRSKLLLPCYRDMDPYDLPEALSILQSYDMGKIGFIQDLIRGINKVLSAEKGKNNADTNAGLVQHTSPGINVSNLLRRGYLSLEDKDWEKAIELFDNVLNIDVENAEAYLGMMLAEKKYTNSEAFSEDYISGKTDADRRFNRAKQFASRELSEWFEKIIIKRIEESQRQKRIQEEQEAERKRQEEQEAERRRQEEQEAERKRQEEQEAERRRQEEQEAERKRQEEQEEQEAERRRQEEQETERKRQEEIDAVVATLELHHPQASRMSPMEQLDGQEKVLKGLVNLREMLPDLLKERAVNEETIKNSEKTISELQSKLQLSGFLKRKERIAIETQLHQISEERARLCKANDTIVKQIGEYSTTSQVENKIRECEKQIEQLKAIIENKDNNTMSYKEAVSYIRLPAFRAEVRKRNPALRNRIYLAETGDEITFGNYLGEIAWQVLERKDNKLFLVSKYGLCAVPYNKDYRTITWETCSLRQWLNEVFLKKAFSAEEQKLLILMNVPADRNPEHATDSGKETKDKIFLLSISEVDRYFKTNEERKCTATALGKDTCSWWLRSPGIDSFNAAFVNNNGAIYSNGSDINHLFLYVRPALCVDLDNV